MFDILHIKQEISSINMKKRGKEEIDLKEHAISIHKYKYICATKKYDSLDVTLTCT